MAHAALDGGHEVAVFVNRAGQVAPQLRELAARGARLHRRGHSYRLGLERVAGRLARRPMRLPRVPAVSPFAPLFRFRPDVVLLSEGALLGFLHVGELTRWLGRSGTPYVTICHYVSDFRPPPDAYRAQGAAFYAGAHLAGFVADGNRETAERQLSVRLANAAVVRNPVNLRVRAPVAPPPESPVRMASVARLQVGDKGQDVLLQVLSQPAWRGREWRLNLFGGGPDERYLRELARLYGVHERVEFRGHVDDVRAIWAENHLLVMPSRAEGTPLALVEAMLCGRPAVATDVGGIAEWVHEGRTGFLADVATPRSFGAALERAWAGRADWDSVGARAHALAARQAGPRPELALLDIVLGAAHARGGRR
jgi:glycosyltransferase involved in cell wall biosynthesis